MTTSTTSATAELVAAAAPCAGERRISRRLTRAVASVWPELEADAREAFARDERAALLPIGGLPQPAPRTAADRVWARLDAELGPEITRAALDRARTL